MYERALKDLEAKLERQLESVEHTREMIQALKAINQKESNATQTSGTGKQK